MSYSFSFLSPDVPSIESTQILCYYTNTSSSLQSVRATDRVTCYLECVVFPKERILFLACPDSFLEISSSTINGIALSKIGCKSLIVADQSTLSRDLLAS